MGFRVPSRRGPRVQIPPSAFDSILKQYNDFVKTIELKDISKDEKQRYKKAVKEFLEACSYQIEDNRIIIYINKLKKRYSPSTARKRILRIRLFLKFINHPLAEHIELPKVPKRRKIVVKAKHIRAILAEVDNLPEPYNKKLKSAVLLAATSGIRAGELYRLRLDDIDIEQRIIRIKAEIAKDYEDRVTFFSEEAHQALIEYLRTNPEPRKPFSRKSIQWHFSQFKSSLRMKHMRKFFSQQSDRLGMPTAVKKILMGHSLGNDIDLGHYDFQDEEDLKKIYDRYWRNFKIRNPNH